MAWFSNSRVDRDPDFFVKEVERLTKKDTLDRAVEIASQKVFGQAGYTEKESIQNKRIDFEFSPEYDNTSIRAEEARQEYLSDEAKMAKQVAVLEKKRVQQLEEVQKYFQ